MKRIGLFCAIRAHADRGGPPGDFGVGPEARESCSSLVGV